MTHYRIYRLDPDDHIVGPPKIVACDNDGDAVAQARQLVDRLAMELWDGARLVERFAAQPQGAS